MMEKTLKKILFVDDDQDIHQIVGICLRDIDSAEVRSAFSGEEAVKIAVNFLPDLVLLDVMMPEMDGITTLQTLKLLPSFVNTPIVFVTAKAQKNEVAEYLNLGAYDVIVKPFDPMTFADQVRKIWNNFQNRSAQKTSL